MIGIDRDPARDRARRRSCRSRRSGRLDAGRGALLRPRSGRCSASASPRSTASCSISAFRRCSSTRPARGFSFRLDGPLDMRMGATGPSAADVVAHASERDLAAIIATLGEERHARAVARAIVRARAASARSTPRARSPISLRGVVHARAGRDPSGHAHVPGAAHLRQRRARRTGARRSPRPSACSSPAGGWWWSRSIRSKTASSRRSSPSAAARRPASRHLPEIAAAPPTFRCSRGGRSIAGRGRDRRQSARALGEAARRRAHRCARRAPRDRGAAAAPALARRRHAGARMILRVLNLCVIGALVLAAAYVYRDQVRVDACRPSASPSCAARSGASATPSRRCAPNGRSSTTRRASRSWRKRHLQLQAGRRRRNSTARQLAGAAAAISCRPTAPIRSAS